MPCRMVSSVLGRLWFNAVDAGSQSCRDVCRNVLLSSYYPRIKRWMSKTTDPFYHATTITPTGRVQDLIFIARHASKRTFIDALNERGTGLLLRFYGPPKLVRQRSAQRLAAEGK